MFLFIKICLQSFVSCLDAEGAPRTLESSPHVAQMAPQCQVTSFPKQTLTHALPPPPDWEIQMSECIPVIVVTIGMSRLAKSPRRVQERPRVGSASKDRRRPPPPTLHHIVCWAEPSTPQPNGLKVTSLWPQTFKNLGTLQYLREDQVQPTCCKAKATKEINAQGQPRISGWARTLQGSSGGPHFFTNKGMQSSVQRSATPRFFGP